MASSRSYGLLAAITGLFLGSCADSPNTIVCPSGVLCPEGMQCAAFQPVCLVNNCGNGKLDVGEVCDDGNIIDGDGCASNCLSNEKCGNGIIDHLAGEVCDDGNAVGGDGCSADCKSTEVCGNGIRDVGEACDDGNTIDADGCSANCKSTEVCGNGIVDTEVGEVCDDNNTVSGDGCNADCRSGEGCGNGILDPGEECDDGNQNDNDDCLHTCVRNVCGDGIVDSAGTHKESCDAGTTGTPVETATCNLDCTTASCGDGKVNQTAGEECDDGFGNNKDTNNCVSNCKLNICGDGKVDMEPPRIEQCDDGNTDNADGCNNACQLASCGNGQLDPGEQCDDGNNITTDACVACHNAICGDGFVEAGVEQCDDGNTVAGDGCSPTCHTEGCGNGQIDPGEQCDDANQVQTDACLDNCRIATCGDGFVHAGVEQCDDGNTTNGDGCSANCMLEGCGNGVLDPGEQCDDGNKVSGDGCSMTCQFEACGDGVVNNGEACDTAGESATCNADCTLAMCGDSKVNAHAGEQCDQGVNNSDNKDCTAGCKINVCGDGKVDNMGTLAHREQCDDGNTVNNDGCSNACMSASCGNGVIDPGEECDDMNADNTDGCVNCRFARCGDGFIEMGTEECDGAPVNGKICSSSCRLEFCGNGILDLETTPPEQCDDGNTTDDGNGCSTKCKHIFCGDGIVNNGEACDPAPPASSPHCTLDCKASTCGDGKLGNDEQCDASAPGADPNAADCVNCKLPLCGDGNPNAGEQCDPGAAAMATTHGICVPGCQTARCGDGYVYNTGAGMEQCDDGMANGQELQCPPNTSCTLCDGTCHTFPGAVCGDGTKQAVEGCDQGDTVGSAGAPGNGITTCGYAKDGGTCTTCSADCKTATSSVVKPQCGDAHVDGPDLYGFGGEKCDLGASNNTGDCTPASPDLACTACSADCQTLTIKPPTAGCYPNDNKLDPGEECDPHMAAPASPIFPAGVATCADVDSTHFDASSGNPSCSMGCKIVTTSCKPKQVCNPNMILEAGEDCDPTGPLFANGSSGGTASLSCLSFDSNSYAGGNLSCTSSCKVDVDACVPATVCHSDGLLVTGEQCDPMGSGTFLGGISTCVGLDTTHYSGGNLTCDSTCRISTAGCVVKDICVPDNAVEGSEACDPGTGGSPVPTFRNGVTTCVGLDSGHFSAGNLKCTACQIDTSGCTRKNLCNNGTLDSGEDCDMTLFAGTNDCATLDPTHFSGGTLMCSATCQVMTSTCTPKATTCGNGVLDAQDACDKVGVSMTNTFHGETCLNLGFEPDGAGPASSLGCDANCQIVTTGCYSCEDAVTNGTETDLNCGGGTCPGCGSGKTCKVTGDCLGGLVCDASKKCNAPLVCSDGAMMCGGACPKCPVGGLCNANPDCMGADRCFPDHTCEVPLGTGGMCTVDNQCVTTCGHTTPGMCD